MKLTKTAETTSTITLSWEEVPDAVGYRFIVDGKTSHTWDPTRTSVKVSKGAERVMVEALGALDSGVWPSPTVPDPVPVPTGQAWPRTYVINLIPDISTYWKYDWVSSFPWHNVEEYHRLNPAGIATTYTRFDWDKPFTLTQQNPNGDPIYSWDCSNMNWPSGVSEDSRFVAASKAVSLTSWGPGHAYYPPNGIDNVTDGQAKNVGYMRPYVAGDTRAAEDCCPPQTNWTWNLGNVSENVSFGQLMGKIQVYNAKRMGLYRRGWNGVWSDNAFDRISAAWTTGLHDIGWTLRQNLPGKIVGGNGAWIQWYRDRQWNSPITDGWWRFCNANLVEGFNMHFGAVTAGSVASFIDWWQRGLAYPDPFGQPRYCAFWDFNPTEQAGTHQRMRWGLTLALMAGMYYSPPSTTTWYDEFWGGTINQRGYLGQPRGAATQVEAGVWKREFDNGIAVHNSSGSQKTVQLGGTFRRLSGTQAPAVNNGQAATAVSLQHVDGLILVR